MNHSTSLPGAKTLTSLAIALMLAACGGGGSSGGDDVADGGTDPTAPTETTHTLTVQVQGLPEGATLPVTYGSSSDSLSADNASLAVQASSATSIALGKLALATEQPYLVQCAFAEPLAGALQSDGSLQASFSADATQVVQCGQTIGVVLQASGPGSYASKVSGLQVLTAGLDGTQAQWLPSKLEVMGGTTNRVLALMGNELYVSARDEINSATGFELRATDIASTRLVKDINANVTAGVGADSSPSGLLALGGRLYFSANDASASSSSLWVSDGTQAGTQRVLLQGSAFNNPENLTVAGGKLFFRSQAKVYAIDGNGTVTDLGLTQTTGSFSVVGDRVFLTDDNGSQWFSDGTAAGTEEFTAATINYITELNGSIYFAGTAIGARWWANSIYKTDGTDAGTQVVVDGTSIEPSRGRTEMGFLQTVNGKLIFSAYDGTGSHLYASDGTPAGTQAIHAPTSLNTNVFNLGNRLVFRDTESETSAVTLWTTDGTAAGTQRLSAEGVASFITKTGLQQVGPDRLVFTIHKGDSTSLSGNVWITDGTVIGTKPLQDEDDAQIEVYEAGSNAI